MHGVSSMIIYWILLLGKTIRLSHFRKVASPLLGYIIMNILQRLVFSDMSKILLSSVLETASLFNKTTEISVSVVR